MTSKTQTKTAQPLYDPSRIDPAYHLRYSWTAWPSSGRFEQTPRQVIDEMEPLWKKDGMRLLEYRWTEDQIQILFSATPSVSPVHLASRSKGRLDHAIREAGLHMPLSRKLAVRSVGDNTTNDVEAYIERQVSRERFVDPRFEALMESFTITNDEVDLSLPSNATRGRYWYNLHLVLVVADRFQIVDPKHHTTTRDWCLKIADKKGYEISCLSVMPDHLHIALRGNYQQSPNEIVSAFQNNLAYAHGQKRIWRDSFYVGTFGEYTMTAVRNRVRPR